MMTNLCLHYAPDNASLCVRLALEHLGLSYDTQLVDRKSKAQRKPAYLALNPNGLIPVLETPHGPMFETAAILLWLSDRHGQLMPATNAPERAHAMQWLFWLSNTLHTTQRMLFYPEQFTTTDIEPLRAATRQRLCDKLTILNNATHADWLDSDTPSANACYLGPLLRWCALYGGDPSWFDLARWPRLNAFALRTEAQAAAQRATTAEGLGATPFSAPHPCKPPEGSPV